jgi:hypothetical protein
MAPLYFEMLRGEGRKLIDAVPPKQRTADFYLVLGVLLSLEKSSQDREAWGKAATTARTAGINDPAFFLAVGDVAGATQAYPFCAEAFFLEGIQPIQRGIASPVSYSRIGMDVGGALRGYNQTQSVVLEATKAYEKALKLKPDDPLFVRAGTLFAKMIAQLRQTRAEIDEKIAANQADRDALKQLFQLTVDVASAFAVVEEAIDPEYVPVKGAIVKHQGADQCALCGGTGQVLAHPFVEISQRCLACGGGGDLLDRTAASATTPAGPR